MIRRLAANVWAVISHDPKVRKATRAAEATAAALLVAGLADGSLSGGEIKLALAGAASAALGAWVAKPNAS